MHAAVVFLHADFMPCLVCRCRIHRHVQNTWYAASIAMCKTCGVPLWAFVCSMPGPSHGVAVSPLCHGVAVSPLCHGVAVSPLCHGVAVSPLCHGVAVSPLCHGGAVSPLCHGVAVSPLCHGVA
eukprot:277137-Chlamydomonas_euryale.AAC.1